MVNSKNLQIIIRPSTNIVDDKAKRNNTVLKNYGYPNPKRQTYKYATQVFKDIATQEDRLYHQSTKVNELFQLVSKYDAFHYLLSLLNMLK